MTRGRFVLFCDDVVLISYEANGDMYFSNSGYGNDAVNALEGVSSAADFALMLIDFNATHHKYTDLWDYGYFTRVAPDYRAGHEFDIKTLRGVSWTDYVYYKNISAHDITLIDTEDKELVLKQGCLTVTYFGAFNEERIPEKYRAKSYMPSKSIQDEENSAIDDAKAYRRLYVILADAIKDYPLETIEAISRHAEAYWLALVNDWATGNDMLTNHCNIFGDIDMDIWEGYVKKAPANTILVATKEKDLYATAGKAISLGLEKGKDFDFIMSTFNSNFGLWFKPLPVDIVEKLSEDYAPN